MISNATLSAASRSDNFFGASARASSDKPDASVISKQIEVQDRVAGSRARKSTQGVLATLVADERHRLYAYFDAPALAVLLKRFQGTAHAMLAAGYEVDAGLS